jgi:hypothetical protein
MMCELEQIKTGLIKCIMLSIVLADSVFTETIMNSEINEIADKTVQRMDINYQFKGGED